MSSLKQRLLEEYDGFADKRIKKLESGSLFIADDRGGGDHGARLCLVNADRVELFAGIQRRRTTPLQ